MSFVQAFHTHDRHVNTEQSDQGDTTHEVEKCKICEFYIHKQNEAIHSFYPPVLAALLPTWIIYNNHFYIGNYKFTLQGFTNKGPPQLLS